MIQVTDCRHGRMMYMDNDKWIGKSYAIYGECLQNEIDFISHFVKPGDVVIDGGANMGAITIPLAQMVGDNGHVYAFEPQRHIRHILCGNIALNNLYNVTVEERPLWEHPYAFLWTPKSKREWYEVPDQHMAGVEMSEEETPDGDPTIGTTIDCLELERLDFIKLDIEGAEPRALRGAKKTIEKCQPVMLIEAIPPTDEEIFKVLNSMDYAHRHIRLRYFNPNNWRGVKDDVLKEDNDPNPMISLDILCYPKSKPDVEFQFFKAASNSTCIIS